MNLLETSGVTTIMTSAVTQISSQVTEGIMAVLPSAVAIAGIYIVVKSVMRTFKGASR